MKKLFTKLGHEIVADCDNGFDAIELYKKFNPDLVTLDITMPNKNGISCGIQALKEIKKFDTNANVLMISSHGEQKKLIQAMKNGAKAYLLKPVSLDKIKTTINKIGL